MNIKQIFICKHLSQFSSIYIISIANNSQFNLEGCFIKIAEYECVKKERESGKMFHFFFVYL